MDKQIKIFALAATGSGISGSDRIFIEFARYWSMQIPTEIFLSSEGRDMCQRQNLKAPVKFQVTSKRNYLAKIAEGIRLGLTLNLPNPENLIVYSASEFWMDSLPAYLLKLRFPKIKWAAAWYQTAPNPVKGFSESNNGGRSRLRALIYWLMQLPVKPLISNFSDFVFVNNDLEKKQFPKLNLKGRTVTVLGAVDLKRIKDFQNKFKTLPKIYDAVFQGRFHPQKGVLELISIWKKVTEKRPEAKLIMIGDGPLMNKVKSQISHLKLSRNVILKGYLFDGEEKYRIFAQSRIVLHPAYYDSGGMASAEAMAFGLPCVGFNLASYKYYYPRGMIKAQTGDINDFVQKITVLLENKNLYSETKKEALSLINNQWSWDFRSRQILKAMLE